MVKIITLWFCKEEASNYLFKCNIWRNVQWFQFFGGKRTYRLKKIGRTQSKFHLLKTPNLHLIIHSIVLGTYCFPDTASSNPYTHPPLFSWPPVAKCFRTCTWAASKELQDWQGHYLQQTESLKPVYEPSRPPPKKWEECKAESEWGVVSDKTAMPPVCYGNLGKSI